MESNIKKLAQELVGELSANELTELIIHIQKLSNG